VNPHGDGALCSTCHLSGVGSKYNLRFGADVSKLCRSCHDGRRAAREAHPADLVPSDAIAKRIGRDFPLENGMLTCSTCHDVTLQCRSSQPTTWSKQRFLRGPDPSSPLEFCFCCHVRQNNRRFNAHDQLEGGKPKVDTCIWCHTGVPDVESNSQENVSRDLRGKSTQICGNCHPVAKGHPNDGSHMGATPSEAMMAYMSAYELQPRMKLPLKRLLEYVRAAKRAPRSLPLDENGRIACYTCHNPHEKGLLPSWNPRSIGSEPKHAVNHRLRAREGQVCIACHQK
jgi:Doubled CXXCH motif (Paired_CXXCH_1)